MPAALFDPRPTFRLHYRDWLGRHGPDGDGLVRHIKAQLCWGFACVVHGTASGREAPVALVANELVLLDPECPPDLPAGAPEPPAGDKLIVAYTTTPLGAPVRGPEYDVFREAVADGYAVARVLGTPTVTPAGDISIVLLMVKPKSETVSTATSAAPRVGRPPIARDRRDGFAAK